MNNSFKITNCIGTYNSLPYLKLAIHSIRKNEHFKGQPLIIFADGCTDGTNEWLIANKDKYNLTLIIEDRCEDSSNGYGMNRCAEFVNTEFISFLHADMYMAKDFDLHLLNAIGNKSKYICSSYRIQPNIFCSGKEADRLGTVFIDKDYFGNTPETFNDELFEIVANEFINDNKNFVAMKAEGCSFIISKNDWIVIGGNDLRFKPNGYDDIDLFIRMRQEGFHFETIASSVCYHFAGRGANGYFGNNQFITRNPSNYRGEQQTARFFVEKWGKMPKYDNNHMPYV